MSAALLGVFCDASAGAETGIRDGHDVILLHDQVLHTIQHDILTGVLSDQDGVSRLDIQRHPFAILVASAEASRQDLALLWLFLGGIRNDDGARALSRFLEALNDETIVKRSDIHG